tara:strand:+ start:8766 stop:9743 length:978 start_codon:yes stop_codon:yes gene_type:complete
LNNKSIEIIVQEKRYSDYVKVLNFIEINKCYELVNQPQFFNYLVAVYEKYIDNSVLNLFLKANVDVGSIANDRSVIIVSPNFYSRYTLSVVENLLSKGITVEGIVCVRFSLKRVYKEIRISFGGFFKKVINKLLLRDRYYSDSLLTKYPDLKTLSKEIGIPFTLVDSLNSDTFKKTCDPMLSRLIVFTGGGIISAATLDSLSGKEFVNCHSGYLPDYRGFDCNYWAIYNEDFDKIGVSCHLMTSLIDRGGIISAEKISITSDVKSIKQFDLIVERQMVATMCASVDLYLAGSIVPLSQTFENGRKYFKMHQIFINKVELRLFHEG